MVLGGVPAACVLGAKVLDAQTPINSIIRGVRVGAITYSFNSIASHPEDIIKAFADIGIGEMELMSNHCEALAGAPSGRADRASWRSAATEATFGAVRRKIEAAGVAVRLLCYNMNVNSTTDAEIEYAFLMARALGASAISTSTQVSMARRLAPVAEKYKMMVGFHGHDSTDRPDEVHNEESFKAVMAAGQYLGANLDIGHFMVAKGDPVDFLKRYHDRITNVHLKDKKRDGTNVAWGQGDTPIKDVLRLMRQERWPIPANIEYVHEDPDGAVAGVRKCFQYIKDALET